MSSTGSDRCDRPPEGWFCTLDRGHDGPCPTHPVEKIDVDAEVNWLWDALDRLVRGHDMNAYTKKDEHLTEFQKEALAHARVVLAKTGRTQ